MKAIILSAGLGTRLRPLTTVLPKPLIPVANRPLIDILIHTLKGQGFSEFGINLHHLPECIREHLAQSGEKIHYSHEPVILDTGGGIAQFAGFLEDDDCFLVHNGDIISNIGLKEALNLHRERRAMATLILINNAPTNVVNVLPDGRIIDIRSRLGALDESSRMRTFSGIAFYDTRIFSKMAKDSIFSIIDFLIGQIQEGRETVLGYAVEKTPGFYWRDIGSILSFMELHRDILEKRIFEPAGIKIPPDGKIIANGAMLSEDTALEGFVVMGRGARTERNVCLKNAIVFSDTVVKSGVKACNTIFADNLVVEVQYDDSERYLA